MASIRERTRGNGSTVYAVLWRNKDDDKQTSMQFDTRPEAERFKRIVEANGNSLTAAADILGKLAGDNHTLRETLIKHVELLTRAGPDQTKRYKRAIDVYFGGDFGAMQIDAIEHVDVVNWVKGMQARTYKKKLLSAKTIANHHGFLSAAMETAVRLRWRADNPCRGVGLPKDTATAEKMRFMTADESQRVVLAHPERYQPLVAFLRATGCRFGEATALKAGDFSLEANPPSVRVEKAWKRGENNRFYLGAPKTKKSRRTVSLPPSLVTTIRPLLKKAQEGGKDTLVFTTSYGGPIRHSTFHEFWTKALDSLGYPKGDRPRIHDLRHTHASLMLAAGMTPYELSRRLGHESIQTTIDRYSHLVPDAHFRAVDIAEKALTA